MTLPGRLNFGIFLAPFHRLGENPTLAIERDLELIQWLDTLGFDEAWIGEHHSAGWETIASPEIFMGVAADRTRHIRLGTGVTSLPYHHPLMVANRMVLLDHLTRGRVMLGVGPGALISDAHMMGIDPGLQRQMMDESLGVILRLFNETEPITYKSSWFELKEAGMQLRSYQQPHVPVAVAAVQSPSGVALAGKHGVAILTASVSGAIGGQTDLKQLWAIAEESAAEHGKTVRRDEWRLTIPVHLAESREEAMNDARVGAGRFQRDYFEDIIGMQSNVGVPNEKIIEAMVEAGNWVVGTPDDCIEAINLLDERSGGFGTLLVLAHEWAPREKVLHSYELLARYVMPQFQGSLTGLTVSAEWSRDHGRETQAMRKGAIDRAKQAWAERK